MLASEPPTAPGTLPDPDGDASDALANLMMVRPRVEDFWAEADSARGSALNRSPRRPRPRRERKRVRPSAEHQEASSTKEPVDPLVGWTVAAMGVLRTNGTDPTAEDRVETPVAPIDPLVGMIVAARSVLRRGASGTEAAPVDHAAPEEALVEEAPIEEADREESSAEDFPVFVPATLAAVDMAAWVEADEERPPRRHRRLAAIGAAAAALAIVAIMVSPDGDRDRPAGNATAKPAAEQGAGDSTGDRDSADEAADDSASASTKGEADEAPSSSAAKPSGAPAPKPAAAAKAPSGGSSAAPATAAAPPSVQLGGSPTPTPTNPPQAAPSPAPPKPAPTPAPKVGSFSASTAALPGDGCGLTEWATTLTWSATNATSVRITGTLAPTLTGLPASGSRVVCRALPGAPVGGWTLTATGPGGTATASA